MDNQKKNAQHPLENVNDIELYLDKPLVQKQ